ARRGACASAGPPGAPPRSTPAGGRAAGCRAAPWPSARDAGRGASARCARGPSRRAARRAPRSGPHKDGRARGPSALRGAQPGEALLRHRPVLLLEGARRRVEAGASEGGELRELQVVGRSLEAPLGLVDQAARARHGVEEILPLEKALDLRE